MIGDTIDFGRYVIPIVREEVAKRDKTKADKETAEREPIAVDG